MGNADEIEKLRHHTREAKTDNLSVRIRPSLKGRIIRLSTILDRSQGYVVDELLELGLLVKEREIATRKKPRVKA